MGTDTAFRISKQTKRKGLALGFALSSVVILGMTMACEIAARHLLCDITTTADYTSYLSLKWKQRVTLNSYGFRDREFTLKKPEGHYRIIVIGDSITYGQGVEKEDRFTNILERRLHESDARFEVLNFGKPGAETEDHLQILRHIAVKAEPDYILLQWFVNDVEGNARNLRPKPLRLVPTDAVTGWLHRNSVLFYLLNQQWIAAQERLGVVDSYSRYMVNRFQDPGGPDWLRARHALKEFISTCQETGIPLGIVLFPSLTGTREGYVFGFLHERVIDICHEQGIPCIDLQKTFGQIEPDDIKRYWASRLDAHPGKAAHIIAADEIVNTFKGAWLASHKGPGTYPRAPERHLSRAWP